MSSSRPIGNSGKSLLPVIISSAINFTISISGSIYYCFINLSPYANLLSAYLTAATYKSAIAAETLFSDDEYESPARAI